MLICRSILPLKYSKTVREKHLLLYGLIDHFEPESEARVSIWYGAI